MSTPVPAQIGVVAHYNLLERLDPAGPGELFRARDTRLGRTVVVRLLPVDFVADEAARVAFIEQARGLVALSHPNVTTLFEVGDFEGQPYLAFEFLRGQSLRAEMGGRPMNVRRAIEIAIQMADAVADAHGAGFVHGGLSPDSVVITAKGHAKIPAFPLASRDGFEQAGDEVKLRDYDAPEEANGQEPDDRSDIYSVGAVLFEMLTTRRPLHRGAAAPSATNKNVPKELDEVVLKAVAPNPDSRYQSAATLSAELRSVAAILDVRNTAPEEDTASRGGSSRLVVAVLLILLVGGAVWWFTR
jgi:eukaryotic-like serine/threonine-protein kinase